MELANMAANKNTVPGDKSALTPGGIRIGWCVACLVGVLGRRGCLFSCDHTESTTPPSASDHTIHVRQPPSPHSATTAPP